MHGTEIGEPAGADERHQVQADRVLIRYERGRRDVGLDGPEPVLKELPDRLLSGVDVDAPLLVTKELRHLIGDFMPGGGGEHLALRLAVRALAGTHRRAPAAILHVVNRSFSVSAFSFCHLTFLSLSNPVPFRFFLRSIVSRFREGGFLRYTAVWRRGPFRGAFYQPGAKPLSAQFPPCTSLRNLTNPPSALSALADSLYGIQNTRRGFQRRISLLRVGAR